MHDEDRLTQLFDNVGFPDEPPMEATASDDLRRGRRHLRRKRAATWTSAAAGFAAMATGLAVALPGSGYQTPDPELEVAGGVAAPASEQPVPEIDEPGDGHDAVYPLPFPVTTALILDVAAAHFDPNRLHLPAAISNAGNGGSDTGWRVSSKLDWTIPGETGLGMVQVAVTTPGFADGEYAEWEVGWLVGCDDTDTCTEQDVPGTNKTVRVADPDPETNLRFGVMYQRPDGSFSAVGVYDRFGNNSLEPVAGVDITLEQAIAFVTDPSLHVDPAEAAEVAEQLADGTFGVDAGQLQPDFSSAEVVPAPAAEEMTAAEARAALDTCIEGIAEWQEFEPIFGMWVDADGEPATWVVAQHGETGMLCDNYGAAPFGMSEDETSPHVIGDVAPRVARNFGQYSPAVKQVTVQRAGGDSPLEAVMREGFWYLPINMGDSPPVAYRGYGADGELVYDLTEVGRSG